MYIWVYIFTYINILSLYIYGEYIRADCFAMYTVALVDPHLSCTSEVARPHGLARFQLQPPHTGRMGESQ